MAGRFEAERVLASGPARAALDRLAGRLRAAGYANEVQVGTGPGRPGDAPDPVEAATRLGLGLDTDRRALDEADVSALVGAGAAELADHHLVPRFALFAEGSTLVLLPRDDGLAPDRVYFGRDTMWLAGIARQAGPGRGALADLGTGAGAVAAMLAPDYDRVVATDVAARTAASAAVTLGLNPRPDGRSAGVVCVADVAAGLRPGAYDLVTANPPWVPDLGPGGVARTYARGGETGFELPRRFVVEAAGLLAPGGVAVILGIDVTWADGSRPLVALARGLRRLGHEVVVAPTEAAEVWDTLEEDLTARFAGMVAVSHVVLLVRRPTG